MKECFRNWVLTHEKLYKAIVFMLALVAFLAITAHGCKTMKAEAAVDVPDLRNVPNFDINMLEQYDYLVVYFNGLYYYYQFSNEILFDETGVQYGTIVTRGIHKNTTDTISYLQDKGQGFSYNKVVASNVNLSQYYSGFDTVNYILLDYPTPPAPSVKDPVYLVNAPFFSHVSTEVQNPILLKNAALNKMYTEIQFKLMGQPMTPAGGYEAEFFVDVYLPSMDLLHEMVDMYMYETPPSILDDVSTYTEFQYKLNEAYQNWWLNVSRGKESYKKFTLRFTQTYEHPIDGNVLLNLPHDYLLECIEAVYGSVEDMYLGGITSNKNIYEFCYPTLLKFLTVGQVGNIVHTYNYPDVYYGRYTTITYKANLSTPVVTEYNADYYATGGSDSVDKVVQEEINNAYNDIADKLQSDNQALQDMLDAYYRGENAFSDYNSSDVWSFLSDTTKGLVSVLPSLSGLAAVVGVVFGFLPIQISGMIMTLFVICIFTAIIRFIRG